MQAERTFGMRVFATATGVFAFVALYLLLMSGLQARASRLGAVVFGAAFSGVWLFFGDKKYVRAAVLGVAGLYAALCAACGWQLFCDGFLILRNGGAAAINLNVHGGAAFADVAYSAGSDLLFSSVVSSALGVAAAAVCEKYAPAAVAASIGTLFIMLCAGLYPAPYSAVLLGAASAGVMASHRALSFKAALCYASVAIVTIASVAPCIAYGGSAAVSGLRASVSASFDRAVYGSDSLPEGRLVDAHRMRSSEATRLIVTLDAKTDKLYLKGFTGGEYADNAWRPTDKNEYVQNGYQGLLSYVADAGIPFAQYSTYSALCGNTERYRVTVENVGARSKYVYAPYGVVEYTYGTPYYDLGLGGGAFDGNDYSFTVFDGDESGERVVQEQWLVDETARTPAMSEYINKEKEYRAFAYDTYTKLPKDVSEAVSAAFGTPDAASVNTVAQLVRAHFLGAYRFSDTPDGIEKDFAAEFFGDGIVRANAAYFAAAATFVFRHYGYAARYAEGYLAEALGPTALDRTVDVTDKHAHAWTEVYMDGIGWLPIEVTPTFFSDEDPDVTVDPIDPDGPDENTPSVDPELPPDKPKDPIDPVDPIKPVVPEASSDRSLALALKILLPVVSVLLAAAAVALAAVVRRRIAVRRKLRALAAHGEEFGRAAYGLARRECAAVCGTDDNALCVPGVDKDKTARFMQIIERSVYGGHDPTDGERKTVTEFIEIAGKACSGGGRFKRFIDKYVKCLGLDY